MAKVEKVPLARVFGARQRGALRVPMVQETQLPLRDLSPEVFERVVVEFAWLVEGLRNVHLYGRRGQKQYGLDVVGTARDGVTVVYQAKRFQTITFQQIRDALQLYAGRPAEEPAGLPSRRFAASRFILVTSAPIDGDTALTDAVQSMRQEYSAHGLDVDVYGAEHLSRALRDANGLVHAVFGPEWVRAFCGTDPPEPSPGTPSPFGLLEDPLEELGLADVPARARQLAGEAPQNASELLSSVAGELRAAGYPGHADMFLQEAGSVLLDGGHAAEAFDIEWGIAFERFLRRSWHEPRGLRDWRTRLADDEVRVARSVIMDALREWYGGVFDLAGIVEALDVLRDADDPKYTVLTCVALEQALTDGLFTTTPPASWIGTPLLADAADLLDRLLGHGRHAGEITRDRTWRCRLRCALADVGLDRQRQNGAAVAAAYGTIVADASAGRMPPHAAGLAHARCARAYAAAGDVDASVDQWRRSFMESIRAGYGGDARSAMFSLEQTVFLVGVPDIAQMSNIIAGIPNRRSFLEGGHDAYFGALEDLQAGRLHGAIQDARRSVLQERVGGYISGERKSLRLLSDVLNKSDRHALAAVIAVIAGHGKVAASRAEAADEWIDVLAITRSGPPWAAAAAMRVLAIQHDLVPDDRVAEVVELLLPAARAIWHTSAPIETPSAAAFDALARFAFRVDEARAAALLDLAEPGLTSATSKTKEAALIAGRIVARHPRYAARVVDSFRRAVALQHVDDELWLVVRKLSDVLSAITEDIRACAARGDHGAVETLTAWGIATAETRRSARECAYRLLLKPVGRVTNIVGISQFCEDTARLVRALVRDGDGDDAPLELERTIGDATDGPPDDERARLAAVAAGDVTNLAEAVVSKLLGLATDRLAPGQGRAEAVRAIALLRDVMPPARALEIAGVFLELSAEVDRHPLDALAFTTDPLAASHWNTPPETVQAAAVDAASRLYAAAVDAEPGLSDEGLAARIAEAAEPLLRSDNDRDCIAAAWSLADLANSDTALVRLAGHRLADVRALAMRVWERSTSRPMGLAAELAADPSPKVRASVARRYAELATDPIGAAVLAELAADRHHAVREVITRSEPSAGC
ncbi:hypothetical protein ACL02O_23630 [Micromonospora sp. MS34]|uniref:hypothetical protein n=1 Tax=Micromonospora sp. MS34 TaxID=3385971 RepID=UPI0039A142B6